MADQLGELLNEAAEADLGPQLLQRPAGEQPGEDAEEDSRRSSATWWMVSSAALLVVLLLVAVVALRSEGPDLQVDTPATDAEPDPPVTTELDSGAAETIAIAAERTMETSWRGSWSIGLGRGGPQRVTYVPASGYRFDGQGPSASSTIVTGTGRFTGTGSLRHGEWHFDPTWVPGAESKFDAALVLPLLAKQLTDVALFSSTSRNGPESIEGTLDADRCQAFSWEPVTSPCRMEVELADQRIRSVEVRRVLAEPGTRELLVRLEVGPSEPGLTVEEPGPPGNWPGLAGPLEVGPYSAGTPAGEVPGLTRALDFLQVPFDPGAGLELPGDQCWVDIPSEGELGACLEASPEGGYALTRLTFYAGELDDPDKGLAEQGPGSSARGSRVEVPCSEQPGELLVRFGDDERAVETDSAPMCVVEIDRGADEAGWVILRHGAPLNDGRWDEVQAFFLPPGDSAAG